MRNVIMAIALGLAVLALGLGLAFAILGSQPQHNGQLRNAYWPYPVETSVRDR